PDGGREREARQRPRGDRAGPHHAVGRGAPADSRGHHEEGRPARDGAARRHHGGEGDLGAHSTLSSAAPLARGRETDAAPRRLRHRGDGAYDGADRRRDGGADGRVGCGAHDLRHGESGRQSHGDRRYTTGEEDEAVKILVAIYSTVYAWNIPDAQVD